MITILRRSSPSKENLITICSDATLRDSMHIGIMSDTHDNLPMTKDAVARLNREEVDLVLHAGDINSPFIMDVLSNLTSEMIGVFGNNDGDWQQLMKKCTEYGHLSFRGTFTRFMAGDLSVGLIHGSDRELMDTLLAGGSLDLLVYGHSHKADIQTYGTMLAVNPGEVCGYLTGKSTVAILDTENRQATIIPLS
jgi:putative phosphoesterase